MRSWLSLQRALVKTKSAMEASLSCLTSILAQIQWRSSKDSFNGSLCLITLTMTCMMVIWEKMMKKCRASKLNLSWKKPAFPRHLELSLSSKIKCVSKPLNRLPPNITSLLNRFLKLQKQLILSLLNIKPQWTRPEEALALSQAAKTVWCRHHQLRKTGRIPVEVIHQNCLKWKERAQVRAMVRRQLNLRCKEAYLKAKFYVVKKKCILQT